MRRLIVLSAATVAALLSGGASARTTGGTAVALVTAETENELLAVSLPPRRVLKRVRVSVDPQNVAVVGASAIVVVSAASHAVTVLTPELHVVRVFRGFAKPHLATITPDGKTAYVTDDGSGLLTVVDLTRPAIVAHVRVGAGAHHVALSPDGNVAWIALGEHARTIVVLDTVRTRHPRVVGRFDPGFPAHDIGFSPDDRLVWVTSDGDDSVRVFARFSRRLLFTVAIGPPPQHVAFGPRGAAYVTSGYGGRIVQVDVRGRTRRSAGVPYGSFNVATAGSFVVTSSLLRGTVTELDDALHVIRTLKVAPAARDVAVEVR